MQADWDRVQGATKAALQGLRDQRLLTFWQAKEGATAEWVPTEIGRAVFESAMPTKEGTALYHSLAELCTHRMHLQDQAQLIYMLIQVALVWILALLQPAHQTPKTSYLSWI